tara:strand:- start:163 stop:768 length:606 start_codon:yes stop_codon:yes gene_type:complete
MIILRSPENEALVSALKSAIEKIKVGYDDNCFMGPVVSNDAADRVLSFVAELEHAGATVLKPVERPDVAKALLLPGLVDITAMKTRNDGECFGPLLQLEWVDSLDEAIESANNTRYGLSAGLLSDHSEAWDHFMRGIRAGIVNLNSPLTGASGASPFGGVGASGNYRPGAFYAADYCAYPVASMVNERVALPEAMAPGIEL